MVDLLRTPWKLFTIAMCIAASIGLASYDTPPTGPDQPTPTIVTSDSGLKVLLFTIHEEIMKPARFKFERAMREADSIQADVILLDLDTYGGAVDVADDISQGLLNAKQRTIVFIRRNAASAGALISIACDSIYMAEGSTIGAASVVDGSGVKAEEKFQSYFRGKFRAVAKKKGRNPDIAEAMVDESIEVPGVIEAGRLITFTSDEALKHNFCDGIVSSPLEALEAAGIHNYTLVELELRTTDKIIRVLTSPFVSGILIMMIFMGIFWELQTPGVGVPLIGALLGALLYFAPHYIEGLAESWEILLFVLGLILLGVELFVIPGFGIAGVSGILLIVIGLVLSISEKITFEGDYGIQTSPSMITAIGTVVIALLASVTMIALLGKRMTSPRFAGKLILSSTTSTEEGYAPKSYQSNRALVGNTGMTASDLRPAGKVDLGDDRYDAQTEGEYILKGAKVRVVRTERAMLIVREVTE